jgi:oligopeptide transport system substrate-binding protein
VPPSFVRGRIKTIFLSIALALVVALAPILVSCGQNANQSAAERARRAQIGGPSGDQLAERQVLHKGNGAEPQTLDPHRAEGVPSSNILRDLFEGLITEAPDGTLMPGVAKRWDISADGKTYTFRLREDARWSNGDPVTAKDFVYGLRRSVNPKTLSQYSSILYPVRNAEQIINGEQPAEILGVRAPDDFTLVIDLHVPAPYLLGLLTHSTTYPVHRASVEEFGNRFVRPGNLVSNGAYKLDEWIVQSRIKLVRNEQYWDNANTIIDEIYVYSIENSDAELNRYRASELDITEALPYQQLNWIRENLGEELIISPYLGSYFFGFNVTQPPFKDNVKLRTALAMAIDRDIITQRITGAGEIAAFGWVPPVMYYEGQSPEWSGWTQEERNSEARRLFREAGYSAANPLEVEILYNTSENHKRVSVAIASMWNQVLGVKTSLVNQEWKVFLETRKRRETTQIFRSGWIGDYNDAFSFAQYMHSANELGGAGYHNPAYDALVDGATLETDPVKREALMQEAERVLLEDMPIIPIYFYVSKHLVKPWVGGFDANIMDHHYSKHLFILSH